MTATVVKSAYVALSVVQDDDRIIADLHREAAAGPGRFAIMAGEQPFAIPDQFHIEPEEIGIGVKALVQGIALSAAFDPLPHLLPRIHPQASRPKGKDRPWWFAEERRAVRAEKPKAMLSRLLIAHRDRSSSNRSRLVSGLRSCPSGRSRHLPRPMPSGCRRDFRSATVAGAAPACDRLPNSPPSACRAAPRIQLIEHRFGQTVVMKAT